MLSLAPSLRSTHILAWLPYALTDSLNSPHILQEIIGPQLSVRPIKFLLPLITSHDSAALLRFEDGDPLRLHLHATQILKRKVPILQALEQEVGDQAWIARCAEALGILVQDLLDEAAKADAV